MVTLFPGTTRSHIYLQVEDKDGQWFQSRAKTEKGLELFHSIILDLTRFPVNVLLTGRSTAVSVAASLRAAQHLETPAGGGFGSQHKRSGPG